MAALNITHQMFMAVKYYVDSHNDQPFIPIQDIETEPKSNPFTLILSTVIVFQRNRDC